MEADISKLNRGNKSLPLSPLPMEIKLKSVHFAQIIFISRFSRVPPFSG